MTQAATASRGGGGRGRAAAASKTKAIRILTIEEIDQADDLPETTVSIPEWGKDVGVKIKALTEQQRADVLQRATVNGEIVTRLVDLHAIVESMVEPKMTVDQVDVLMRKNAVAIDRIKNAMTELNGLNKEALEALEAAFRALSGPPV